ncbi:MAG: hypothetical protein Tsb0010_13200 [Parvularculaceae bacterium]
MKKEFFAAALAAAAVAAAASSAAAANASGTIELSGSVPLVCDVSIVDAGAALNLVAGASNEKVASITENCNAYDGYVISFKSSNRGALKSADGEKVEYTINYDNKTRKSLASEYELDRKGARFNALHSLAVNVPANERLAAGDYRDTITISIEAK